MAIESVLAALTVALDNHTAALNNFVKSAGKGGSTASAAADSPKDKPAGNKPAGNKPAGGKKITLEQVQKKFGDFLKVGDKPERDERLATVKKINAHFEVPKMTEADPSIWPDAFKVLDRIIEGEDVDDVLAELSGDGGDGDDGDDGDSVV